jgi:hypothetical protein
MFKNLRRSLLALAVVAGSSVAVKVAYAAESDGTVDLGFGASGVASFEGEFRFTLALSDGKVVAFATVDADDDYNPDKVEIRRFTSAGALDTNFGLNGTMTIEPSGHTYVQYEYSFADNAGGFYMVYSSNDPNQGPMQYDAGKMIKVTSAGVQDLNFGTGGEAVLAAPAGGQSVGGHWVDSSSGNIYTVQYGNVSALLRSRTHSYRRFTTTEAHGFLVSRSSTFPLGSVTRRMEPTSIARMDHARLTPIPMVLLRSTSFRGRTLWKVRSTSKAMEV